MQPVSFALLLTLFTSAMQSAIAADCMATSGKQTVPLLELYTSEGCSSCPPADKWLSGLAGSGYDAGKVVALAFHVDYWDYIGWKDRYAKASYSERQRQVNALGGSTFVYTPQITLNGKDFRGWAQRSRFNDALEGAWILAPRASISIEMGDFGNKQNVTIRANSMQPKDVRQAEAYIAIYENQLKSEVNAGENSGRQLRHDYVVRELYGPYKLDAITTPNQGWQHSLALGPEWKNRDIGIAAFVQNRSNGEVLQALSMKACL